VGSPVNVSQSATNQSEVAVAINPANPKNIVMTANENDISGLFLGVSTDGGKTFSSRVIANGSDSLTPACCDSSVAFDTYGNLYLGYLDSSDSKAIIALSTDGGTSFSQILSVGSQDQPKLTTGPGNQPNTQSVWMEYLDSNGRIAADGANSTGLGQVGSFVNPEEVAGSDGDNFGKLSIGPQGQVLVSYQDNTGGNGPSNIFVALDPDGVGPLGMAPQVKVGATNVGGFDYITPQGLRSIDAEVGLAYDDSGGPFNGRVYMVNTDAVTPGTSNQGGPFSATGNDTFILLRYSDNDGLTWSTPIRVNDDSTLFSKFFPRVAVDQTTGYVGLSWYDCRNDPGVGPGDYNGVADQSMEVYATISTDGGQTVLPNVQVSNGPSDAEAISGGNQTNDFGDYSGLAFYGNKMFPGWADNSRTLGGNPNLPNLNVATAEVDVQTLTVKPSPLSFAEGISTTSTVATISTADPTTQPSDFNVTINWGDGITSSGLVTRTGPGAFNVSGTHTFVEGGRYPISVSVIQSGSLPTSVSQLVSVTDAALSGTNVSISANEGDVTGAPGNDIVARFSDADPNPTNPSDYNAAINWGDGLVSTGVVVSDPSGGYDILGSHVYTAGNYTATVKVSDLGGSTVSVSDTVTIADLPLTAQAMAANAVEGQVFAGAVASFTDADPRPLPATNYTAVIDFGNGTTAAGTIVASPFGGYLVDANHAFDAGNHNITVTITDSGGSTQIVSSTVTASDQALTARGLDFTNAAGQTYTNYIATFKDGDPRPHPGSDYTVSIDWGDGNAADAGTVIPDGRGGYLVFDNSKTLDHGTYDVTITITDALDNDSKTAQSTTATLTAVITEAPIVAQGLPSIAPTEGVVFTGEVANFTNNSPRALASDFTATINWGDGSAPSNGQIQSDGNGGFNVMGGGHAYAQKGTYAVSVAITDTSSPSGNGNNGGNGTTTNVQSSTIATTTAIVPQAPISPIGTTIAAVQRSAFSGIVGSFADANPLLTAGDFQAIINWGDNSSSAGAIAEASGGQMLVSGSHTYLFTGTFTIAVQISATDGGSATGQSTAIVALAPPTATGGLSPLSNSGGAANGGITNQSTPTFVGTSLPAATVRLFAQTVGTPGVMQIGSGLVGASGTWTIQTTHLPDGAYNIFAQTTDIQGHVGPVTTILPAAAAGPLVVDTQGPNVAVVNFIPAIGQFRIIINDALSGVNRPELLNGANYSLVLVSGSGAQVIPLTGLTLAPGGPTGPQTLLATFAGGKRLKNGNYVLTINSAGIADLAGNHLDERFYVPFPSTYNLPGQNYVAEFNVRGNVATGPTQYVPASEVTAAQLHSQLVHNRPRRRR
jgi:hypothetical protein